MSRLINTDSLTPVAMCYNKRLQVKGWAVHFTIHSSRRSHKMTHLIPTGTTEPYGECYYFTCTSCCSMHHIRTEQWKQFVQNFFLLNFSSHNNDLKQKLKLNNIHEGYTKVQQWHQKKIYSQPMTFFQNHLTGLQEQLKHEWQWFKRAIQFSASHSSD